eukprot:496273_1
MGGHFTAISKAGSHAIEDKLINIKDDEKVDEKNIQSIVCKNRNCYNAIKINYIERYLEHGKDTRAMEWIPDDRRTFCQYSDCSKKFSMINRKHHCRFCGDIFCDSCSQLRISINEIAKLTNKEIDDVVDNENEDELNRICYQCFRKMLQVDCHECNYSFCLLCGKQWHDKMLCFEI